MQILTNCPPPAAAPWPVAYAPILSASVAVVVGLVAAVIAYRQWRTARAKLRLDLFDRRYAVFQASVQLLEEGYPSGDFDAYVKAWTTFKGSTAAARLLFRPEVASALGKLEADLALERGLRGRHRDELQKAGNLQGLNDNHSAYLEWVDDQFEVLIKVFSPYLRFRDKA